MKGPLAILLLRTFVFGVQGTNIRGTPFNLTVYWNIMPITGGLETKSKTFTGFRMPEDYKGHNPYTHPMEWQESQHSGV